MIRELLAEVPSAVPELWTAPEDTDLLWISAYCYLQIAQWRILSNAQYEIRQLEEADGDDMVSAAEDGISAMLADITAAYNPE
jgi:hypothetical protein